ncbi:MAG: ImmA/IrrE family metallo-endopeptidase [Desulfovibrio sp.]|nr:ImmA/IrrE family metallo-endopeptidase [Desulfovibrio sp.]
MFVKFYNPLERKFEKLEIRADRALEYEDDDCLAYIEEITGDGHVILINFKQFNEILAIRDSRLRKYYTDFVLLHEIGHYLLAHTAMDTGQSARDEQFLEEQADQYALQTIKPNRRLRRLISDSEEKSGFSGGV